MNKYTKEKRHRFLLNLLEKGAVGDQNYLLNQLKKNGIKTTQASISRDLQDLGYVKIRVSQGVYKYQKMETPPEDLIRNRLQVLFSNFVTGIKSVNHLLVIKTSPGNANGVASLIDLLDRSEILGTVAGDDTILVIIDSASNRKQVEKDFRKFL
jgi:transcriptional regulator of arginine metabolism